MSLLLEFDYICIISQLGLGLPLSILLYGLRISYQLIRPQQQFAKVVNFYLISAMPKLKEFFISYY